MRYIGEFPFQAHITFGIGELEALKGFKSNVRMEMEEEGQRSKKILYREDSALGFFSMEVLQMLNH